MRIQDTLLEAFRAHEPRQRTGGGDGPRAFASQAGGCVRQTAYGIIDKWPAWDTTVVQEIAFEIGRQMETPILRAIRMQDPSAKGQVPWTMEDNRITGIADAVYGIVYHGAKPDYAGATVVEIKTMAWSSFNYSRKNGPKRQHLLQAALSAVALGAPRIHLVYLSKNSPRDQDAVLEWELDTPVDDATVAIRELLLAVDSAAAGEVPEPWYYGDVISFPDAGREPCMWCDHKERCVRDGPGISRVG